MKEAAEIRVWLIRSVGEQLNQVLETMAGENPTVESSPRVQLPDGQLRFWEIGLSVAPGAQAILAVTAEAERGLGGRVLTAAGLDLDDEETIRSTFQETIDQALSGLAQNATSQLSRQVTATPCRPMDYPALRDDNWSSLALLFGDGTEIEMFLLWNNALLAGFQKEPEPPPQIQLPAPMPREPQISFGTSGGPGKNNDLLYDVELPVCVSFGRAHLQLRDVMKLTTGSVVELNRTVSEPVEIIVNNCVIARGEVVVVEGNFGVRINEVISRQERLRTLH